jgi:glycosyltransferase involved in cell wall biosynthesis
MKTIFHQLQGLYVAGDVFCAVDCVRAVPDYNHVFFINHSRGYNHQLHQRLLELGILIRTDAIVTEHDLIPELQAVLYHCVGNDDRGRGEYVRFNPEPEGVLLCAWIHTPGLCGTLAERYNYLRSRGCSRLVFASQFSLYNTPGIDFSRYQSVLVINPAIDATNFSGIKRINDKIFRIGRWNRDDDRKYSDDFLDLLASLRIPNVEYICMGIPSKFAKVNLPRNLRFFRAGTVPVEQLISQLDVLIYKTHAPTWHEGWCRAVTEAMLAGVVPVVENRGGISEQIIHGYNGFLCDTNEDFRRYCELLYHDSQLCRQMSFQAREYASANFNLSKLRGDLICLLDPLPES